MGAHLGLIGLVSSGVTFANRVGALTVIEQAQGFDPRASFTTQLSAELASLTLGDRACDPDPSLTSAVPVPAGGSVDAILGVQSGCLAVTGGATSYAVFRLPDAQIPATVTIKSLVAGTPLVPTQATVLDGAGQPRRTVSASEFSSSINGLQAGLRTMPDDRYVVVSADPTHVGEITTLRLSLRNQGGVAVAAGPVFVPLVIPISPAPVTHRSVTLSLSATVCVAIAPIRTIP